MSIYTGSGVALITPFKDNKVDFKALEELLEFHVENGTDSIIICGTTGEASTMTTDEKKEVIKFTVDIIDKRIPVIAGTGTMDTSYTIEMSKFAEEVNCDGVLIITPYYLKTSPKGMITHFKEIAKAIDIPIILYNVPSRTNVNLTIPLLKELVDVKNIIAIKEASGNISFTAQIIKTFGDRYDIYSGNDDQIVPIMSLGGKGVISVVANILPKETQEICKLYLDKKVDESLALQLKYLDLINTLFIEPNPIPVKTAMNLMNLKAYDLRLPLVEMEEDNLLKLKEEMKKVDLI